MIVITDPDGAIQYANPAFVRVTGYSVDEVIRQNPRILKSGEHDEAFYETLWQTITGGRTWNRTHGQQKRRTGRCNTEEATISPVFGGQGSIVNFVAIKRGHHTRNSSSKHSICKPRRWNPSARLTGGVAHDFNNILAVIIGYAEMALDKIAPDHPVHADLGRNSRSGHAVRGHRPPVAGLFPQAAHRPQKSSI